MDTTEFLIDAFSLLNLMHIDDFKISTLKNYYKLAGKPSCLSEISLEEFNSGIGFLEATNVIRKKKFKKDTYRILLTENVSNKILSYTNKEDYDILMKYVYGYTVFLDKDFDKFDKIDEEKSTDILKMTLKK